MASPYVVSALAVFRCVPGIVSLEEICWQGVYLTGRSRNLAYWQLEEITYQAGSFLFFSKEFRGQGLHIVKAQKGRQSKRHQSPGSSLNLAGGSCLHLPVDISEKSYLLSMMGIRVYHIHFKQVNTRVRKKASRPQPNMLTHTGGRRGHAFSMLRCSKAIKATELSVPERGPRPAPEDSDAQIRRY